LIHLQIDAKDTKISKLSGIMLEMENALIRSEKQRSALEKTIQVLQRTF